VLIKNERDRAFEVGEFAKEAILSATDTFGRFWK
jgi:hypothetical protein